MKCMQSLPLTQEKPAGRVAEANFDLKASKSSTLSFEKAFSICFCNRTLSSACLAAAVLFDVFQETGSFLLKYVGKPRNIRGIAFLSNVAVSVLVHLG